MRISDWSSDVCSSDLPGQGDVDGGGGTDPGLAVGEVEDLVAQHAAHEVGDRQADQGPHQLHDERGERPVDGAEGVAVPRSEEHTSELQSLMRISYAVFCLKKKITKTNTTDDRNT